MKGDLLWRADVEALLAELGATQTLGRILPLPCHGAAGVLAAVVKDVPAHPGQAVLHLRCEQCRAEVYTVAVVEPIMTPQRCRHRAPLDVGYLRGEVMLACRRCDRVHLLKKSGEETHGTARH